MNQARNVAISVDPAALLVEMRATGKAEGLMVTPRRKAVSGGEPKVTTNAERCRK
jgi:hypothetical protein